MYQVRFITHIFQEARSTKHKTVGGCGLGYGLGVRTSGGLGYGLGVRTSDGLGCGLGVRISDGLGYGLGIRTSGGLIMKAVVS
jgi:hypothetical protein